MTIRLEATIRLGATIRLEATSLLVQQVGEVQVLIMLVGDCGMTKLHNVAASTCNPIDPNCSQLALSMEHVGRCWGYGMCLLVM